MAEVVSINKNKEQVGLLSDEKFSLSGKSLHLSVEVRENELVCCLLDKHSNTYIAFEEVKLDSKGHLNENDLKKEILSTQTADISIGFVPNSFILVPAPFFKKDSLKEYLSFQQLDKQGEIPCCDFIKNLDSYNIYTVNTETFNLLRKHYPSASFCHNSSIFIEFVLTENKHIADNKVFVCVYSTYFDVAVLKAGKLTLSNRFYYSNSSDFIYHLLWVYEQLGLDNAKTPCILYGDIETGSESFKLSNKYIAKLSLGEQNNQSAYATALAVLPRHKYRSLFTQYQCV